MRQLCVWAAGLLLAGSALAAEKSDFSSDAAATLAPTAPAMDSANDSKYLTSMKNTGRVSIGGSATLRYMYTRVKAANGTFSNVPAGAARPVGVPAGNDNTFHANTWDTQVAALRFRVDACDGNYLTIKLDLDDSWNNGGGSFDQDDFLEEIYFTTENICGTGLGSKTGKMEVPFGMDKDVLLLSPYLHGPRESALSNFDFNGSRAWNSRFFGFDTTGSNNSFGYVAPHSTEYDNMFAWVPYWKNDQFLFEASWFQDRNTVGNGGNSRGQRPDGHRTNDPALSFSARATWTPVETLKLMASGITRYHDGAEQADPVNFVNRTYASSLAFDWTPCLFGKKVNFFGEWQHTWDSDFNKDMTSDDIHVGTSFSLTDALTLFAQYEWLHGRQDGIGGAAGTRQLAQRAIAAVQYEFLNGMYAELGYQREWGYIKSANPARLNGTWFNNKNSAHADTIYAGMGWNF